MRNVKLYFERTLVLLICLAVYSEQYFVTTQVPIDIGSSLRRARSLSPRQVTVEKIGQYVEDGVKIGRAHV